MDEIEIITLEDDGQDYVVVDEIEDNGNKYAFLANLRDKKKICVRKVLVENGEEYIDGLDSDEEYDKALLLFSEKHRNDVLG